ncbi:hypothetical protein GCM10027169_00220 [Gordonia jinhuaensis]|uniref:Uncharacterized protein n=1 Tax=Gordonia jinhuaensis TaxID=1517702 RepID=A0A916SV57_9ACTN|nr:hypothetical protein [Gordonia jinhuaensis]GGB18226.1 hypothetical protein GCM10011489_02880 [Gordonia jinhuaensis]
MIRDMKERLRDVAESIRWAVRDWSQAHPPKTDWLARNVLTTDEALEFMNSAADRSTYDRTSQDAAVAAWLTVRGEAHRLPEKFREGNR